MIVYKHPTDVPELDVENDLARVIERHPRFRPIAEYGVRVDILLAYADKDGVPAVKHHGAPALARIALVGPEDRARGNGDVLVTIDGRKYEDRPQRRRDGILAHELYHVDVQTHKEVERDGDGTERVVWKADLDPYGRPVVKLIPDDWAITGFREVAEWYGPDSAEVGSYRVLGETLAAALSVLPFSDPDAGGVSTVTVSCGDKSVTLTGEQFDRIAAARAKPRRGGKAVGA